MGSGKTTIGKKLAEKLHLKWIDLDQFIEDRLETSISKVFQNKGEAYFRKIETECLEQVLLKEPMSVISTGGGVITTSQNRDLLAKTHTIYLAYPFETLYERIKGDGARPLVTTYEALHKRFEDRLPLYEEVSEIKIECNGKSINATTREILEALKTIKKDGEIEK